MVVSGVSDTSGYTCFDPGVLDNGGTVSNNVVSFNAGASSFTCLLRLPQDSDTNNENIIVTLTEGPNFPSGWTLGSANSPNTLAIEVTDND